MGLLKGPQWRHLVERENMLSFLPQFLLLFLLSWNSARGSDCDPVFDDCSGQVEALEDCDPVFDKGCGGDGVLPSDCYSINDVDSDIFTPDTRQAVKVCGQGDRSEYADRGFACAPIYTCKDNRIITDGKGIIDVRRDGDEEELGCVRNSGTIDVSDKKCPKTDEVCCKNPNFRDQLKMMTSYWMTGVPVAGTALAESSSPALTIPPWPSRGSSPTCASYTGSRADREST